MSVAEETASAQPLKMLLTTKRIHDPDLIPSLIESDINFGAVKVAPTPAACSFSINQALPLVHRNPSYDVYMIISSSIQYHL